jgi:transposase
MPEGRPREYPLRPVTEAMLYVVKTGADDQVLARAGLQGRATQYHTHGPDRRFAVGQDGLQKGLWGYDAGKKIKGRKRRIAVDTQGNVLTVVVHPAGVQDLVGARTVLMRLFRRFDTIIKGFVDGGYAGQLIEWAKQRFGYEIAVVKRNEQHMFRVQRKRWVVERALVWLNW